MYMEQKLRLILYYAKIPNLQMPVIKAFLIHFYSGTMLGSFFMKEFHRDYRASHKGCSCLSLPHMAIEDTRLYADTFRMECN